MTFESNVIYSQKSFLPRSVMVNATADVFGYAINAFEVGVIYRCEIIKKRKWRGGGNSVYMMVCMGLGRIL